MSITVKNLTGEDQAFLQNTAFAAGIKWVCTAT